MTTTMQLALGSAVCLSFAVLALVLSISLKKTPGSRVWAGISMAFLVLAVLISAIMVYLKP